MENRLILSEYIDFLFYKNQVIVYNSWNGSWIKMPLSLYEIFNKSIEYGFSKADTLQHMADEEDMQIMKKLLDSLDKIHAFKDSNLESEKDLLDDVSIMVTERCNLSCKHCSASAKSCQDYEFFSTSEMIDIISKIKTANPKAIIITGGEPLVRNDITDIIEHARKNYKGQLILMTNGVLIDEHMAEFLSKTISSIDISLDGVDEKTTSIIRGKGVFNKVLNSIRLLQRNGISKISLSMVATPQNYMLEGKFERLCNELNVMPVFRKFDVLGRAKDNLETLMYVDDDISADTRISTPPLANEMIACTCQGGARSFFIRANGSIFPCQMFDTKDFYLGNIAKIGDLVSFTTSLKSSLQYRNFKQYYPSISEACKECPVNVFCWTCPYYLYKAEKNHEAFLKHCVPQKKSLMQLIWGEEEKS